MPFTSHHRPYIRGVKENSAALWVAAGTYFTELPDMSLLAAIALLGICVFFHELGHYLAGRAVGVTPKIFSIGYGSGWLKRRIGKTTYQITAIPLGGYVQFYGDDITKRRRARKGEFFAASPWRRIVIALAGPLASVLLGYLVILVLIFAGWQPMANIASVLAGSSAEKAGIRNGDRVESVNGYRTYTFEEVLYRIAFSDGPLAITVNRDGKKESLNTEAIRAEDGGIHTLPGLSPAGTRTLYIAKDKDIPSEANGRREILQEGEQILAINGQTFDGYEGFRQKLQEVKEDSVVLNLMKNGIRRTINVPVQKREVLQLTSITDLQTGVRLQDREFQSFDETKPPLYTRIFVDGRSFSEWKDLTAAIGQGVRELTIGRVDISANVRVTTRKMLGIALQTGVEPMRSAESVSFSGAIVRAWDQLWFTAESTLGGLYRVISGKLSFERSVSGPVRIVAIAAKSAEMGGMAYWYLLAQITIVLGIMNLLPLPVLDGGHILFYTIEWIYKPLPVRVIAGSVRIAMAFLLSMGLYVIVLDIIAVFLR